MKALWHKFGIYGLIIIAVVLLAIAVTQVFIIEGFSFEKQINIVDIAAALITIFLAFYVPHRVERAISTQRYEKEALIAEVRQIMSYFDSALNTSQMASSPVTAEQEAIILGAIENSAKALQMLEELFHENGFQEKISFIEAIRSQRLVFKKLATGGNFGKDDFAYSPYVLNLMSTAYHSMKKDFLKLIFSLNKS